MGHYTIDHGAIERLPGSEPVDGPVRRCADTIFAESQVRVPVDSGHLRETGFVDGGSSEYRIGYTAEYAAYVEFGTGPHIIHADPGGELAFAGAGGMVFTDEVHHPGTEAEPYLGPAATKRRGRIG
jgi:hypothetical protein